jgi:NTE family protein
LYASTCLSQVHKDDTIIIRPDYSPAQLFSAGFDREFDPGIGLVLSGGGARGLAHIGILKVLEKEGIHIHAIAGVSMGGVVGGLYSAGYSPEEIETIALNVNWRQLFSPGPMRKSLLGSQKGLSEKSIIKIRFEKWKPVIPGAITSGQNLSQFLEKLAARGGIRSTISFDYLAPPLRIVCTDLSTGERVVVSSGSLGDAMRATLAAPVAFTPVTIQGRLLVDGGLVDPIPVSVLQENRVFPIVAVNTTSELVPATGDENVFEMADQTTTIMSMPRKAESIEMADLLISPDLEGISSTDFSGIETIISAGERAAREMMPRLRELLGKVRNPANDTTYYPVTGWSISGLAALPKTMFKAYFKDFATLSIADIRAGLDSALSTGFLEDAWAEVSNSDSGFHINYILKDYPRVKSIRIPGATLFPDSTLEELIDVERGMILNKEMIYAGIRRIEKKYIDAGYNLVRVSSEFDTAGGVLTFAIDEGRINRLAIEGNEHTRDWVIRRHIPFEAGEIYRSDRAEQGVSDLYGAELFETARFVALPDSQGVSLIARVNEKPSQMVRAGARYDNEYGGKAFFDIVDENVFGAGQQLFVSTTVGEKKRSVSLNFKADRILKSYFTYHLVFDYAEFKRNYYIDHEYEGYNRQFRHGGELSIGRQIPRLGTAWIAGEIHRYRWDEPGGGARRTFDKGSLSFVSEVDTRDELSFPNSGKYHFFRLEFAGGLTGDKTAYTRFQTSLESYYQIFKNLNFHPALSLGLSSNFMPYFDEFTLGGYRGFPGFFQDEVFGDKLFLGLLAFRYDIAGPFFAHLKFSAGNIWNKLENIRFSELKYSSGAGISMKSPLGPMSLWYGRTTKGLDALYINIGFDW